MPRIKGGARKPRVQLGQCRRGDRHLSPPTAGLVQLLARRLARRRAQLELRRGRRLRPGSPQWRWLETTSPRIRAAARSPTGTTLASARAPTVRTPPTHRSGISSRAPRPTSSSQGHDHDYERFGPSRESARSSSAPAARASIPPCSPAPGASSGSSRTFGVLQLTLRPAGFDWRFRTVRRQHVYATGEAPPVADERRYGDGTEAPGHERLLDDAKHLRAAALLDRREAAELEPAQLDAPLRAHGDEAEVLEEVAGEDRPVHEEPLDVALAAPDNGRRTPRAPCAPWSRASPIAARNSDFSTHSAPLPGQVGAGDEHGVVGRRACRQVGRPREEARPARTASSRARGRRRRSRSSPTRRTPPRRARSSAPWTPSGCHATATRRTSGTPTAPSRSCPASARRRVRSRLAPSGGGPMSSTMTSTAAGVRSAIRSRYSATRPCTAAPTARHVDAPVDGEVELDPDGTVVVRHPDAAVARPGAVDEPAHPVDLERGIRRVAREDVRRDERVALHH